MGNFQLKINVSFNQKSNKLLTNQKDPLIFFHTQYLRTQTAKLITSFSQFQSLFTEHAYSKDVRYQKQKLRLPPR